MDSHEAKIYFTLITAGILLGVFIVYFVVSIVRQQRRDIALQKSKILAEIAAMEKERARIAADLHDELGPQLSVVKFKIDYVNNSVEKDKVQLKEASEQLDTLLVRMREISQSLMPNSLIRKGLIVAVQEHVRKIVSVGKMNIEFMHPDDLTLADDTSVHVFRVLQEIIQNCVKHAEAQLLEIKLEKLPQGLRLTCRDDGKGFNYETTLYYGGGMGLSNLKNRTDILGGRMVVESAPGKGSVFIFEIPFS